MPFRAMSDEATAQLRALAHEVLGPDADLSNAGRLVAAIRAKLAAEYENGFRDGFRERGKGGRLDDKGVPRAFRVITTRRRKTWRRRVIRLGIGAVLVICGLLIYAARS